MRIMSQLSAIDRVGYIELEQGVRYPEGIWGWFVMKRIGLRSLGGT